ncbi:MAG: GTPase, partial [Betaproteobacteria bacterium]
MPANLSPEYKAAEASFRRARDPHERLDCLREMLRTIPKHKGTEKLQADIKARIKALSEDFEGGRKGGGHGGPALVIRPEGAAQVALLGPPNSGKSSLHARLTGSEAHVAPYPFTTQFPQPGMMPHEDVHFQLIDLPAISAEHPVPWLASTLQMADAALLVMDLGDADCVDELAQVESLLAERGVTLTERWDAAADDEDPFAVRLPTLLLANKCDQLAAVDEEIEAFRELSGERFPTMKVSAAKGQGLDALGAWLFDRLGVVRVYTKAPGHAFEKTRPFTLRRGRTVSDVARLVHKDLERSLKYARIWGGHSEFEGQQVGP